MRVPRVVARHGHFRVKIFLSRKKGTAFDADANQLAVDGRQEFSDLFMSGMGLGVLVSCGPSVAII